MLFRYQTERLILTASEPAMAPLVTDYLQRNRDDFSKYESKSAEGYYTLAYQQQALEAEQKLFLKSSGVRYYLFLKEQPDYIIGNVSFAYISEDFGHRCTIGYKMDVDYRQNGYAFEACSFLIRELVSGYHIHRIEADILPDNPASIALARKLGFEYEGIARNAHQVAGVDRDHLRYSYIP